MKRKSLNNYTAWLLIVSLFMLLPHLNVFPVNIMEARNFITAREMVKDGHWVLTTLNGEPRYEKPPLPTWLTALPGMGFGFDSLTAMRLPVIAITFLLVGMIYLLSQKMGLSQQHSFHNALILVTSFYIYFAGRDNQWDMYCHSFMIVSIYFLWNLFTRQGIAWQQALWAGVFMGFSILSKGPISLYTLFLPFLIAYGFVYRFTLKRFKSDIGPVLLFILIALFIGLSWPLYVRYADASSFRAVTKEVSRWASYETKPFYYYWSFFTQSGIWTVPALTALLYPFMKKRVTDIKAYRFSLVWTLASVVLLSIIPEKKTRYLLPALIPLAVTTGFYIEYLRRSFLSMKTKNEKWIVIFAFGLIALVGLLFPAAQYFVVKNNRTDLLVWLVLSSVTLFTAGILILLGLIRFDFRKLFYGAIAIQVCAVLFAFPLAKSFFDNPAFRTTSAIKQHTTALKIPLYELSGFCPEIVWDYGEKIPLYSPGKFNDTSFGILAEKKDSLLLQQTFKGYRLEKKDYTDLNIAAKGNNSGKSRLYRDFYIISGLR